MADYWNVHDKVCIVQRRSGYKDPVGFSGVPASAGFNADVWVVFCRRLSWPQETICLNHIQGKTTLGMKVSVPFFFFFFKTLSLFNSEVFSFWGLMDCVLFVCS